MKTRLICPACNSTEVKEIVYGFPDVENFDFDKTFPNSDFINLYGFGNQQFCREGFVFVENH